MVSTFNDGYFDELGHSAAVRALVVGKANEIASRARASAPVDSGQYRDEIRVVVVSATHRVVAKVVAGAEHSMLVESRTGNLARAARAAGSGG